MTLAIQECGKTSLAPNQDGAIGFGLKIKVITMWKFRVPWCFLFLDSCRLAHMFWSYFLFGTRLASHLVLKLGEGRAIAMICNVP